MGTHSAVRCGLYGYTLFRLRAGNVPVVRGRHACVRRARRPGRRSDCLLQRMWLRHPLPPCAAVRPGLGGEPFLYTLNLSCPQELWDDVQAGFAASVASFRWDSGLPPKDCPGLRLWLGGRHVCMGREADVARQACQRASLCFSSTEQGQAAGPARARPTCGVPNPAAGCCLLPIAMSPLTRTPGASSERLCWGPARTHASAAPWHERSARRPPRLAGHLAPSGSACSQPHDLTTSPALLHSAPPLAFDYFSLSVELPAVLVKHSPPAPGEPMGWRVVAVVSPNTRAGCEAVSGLQRSSWISLTLPWEHTGTAAGRKGQDWYMLWTRLTARAPAPWPLRCSLAALHVLCTGAGSNHVYPRASLHMFQEPVLQLQQTE